jgi:hypothetical protein
MKKQIQHPKRPTETNQLAHSVMQDVVALTNKKRTRPLGQIPKAKTKLALRLMVDETIDCTADMVEGAILCARRGNLKLASQILRACSTLFASLEKTRQRLLRRSRGLTH